MFHRQKNSAMQENEFEKKLQQKMDRLQVQPAEEVWQRIEAQVTAKKRKRRGVIFFFMLSGLIMAGLYITDITGVFKTKGTIAANAIKTGERNTGSFGLAASNKKAAKDGLPDEKPQPAASKEQNTKSAGTGSSSAADNSISKRTFIRSVKKGYLKASLASPQPGNMIDDTNDRDTITSPGDTNTNTPISGSNHATAANPVINKNDSTAIIKKEEPVTGTVKKQAGENNNASVTKNNGKEKSGFRKWGLSVIASGGVSATGNNYLKNGVYEANGLGNVPANGGNAGGYMPSKTKAGIAFMAGIQLYRNISEKSRLVTGLQYQLATTSIETSLPITTGSIYYDSAAMHTAKKYNNHYHVLSLPLGFSTSLFRIGQKDICLDAGITYSRLISTDALNFDASQGIYYKDESVFNKSQWGVNAALKFNISGKNRPAFYIGPELYYSLTPLASSGVYSRSHNRFIGLRLQKDLKK
jgi:hypothetical protein